MNDLSRVQVRVMRSRPYLYCLDCKASIRKERGEDTEGASRLSDFVVRAEKHLSEAHPPASAEGAEGDCPHARTAGKCLDCGEFPVYG